MNHKRFTPALETLDGRLAPSVTPLTSPLATATVTTPVHHNTLSGHGSGEYQNDQIESGAGKAYHLTGTATLTELGKSSVKGTLHSVGFIKDGHATGELTFTNRHGSVTVKLTGPLQNGFAALPSKFTYQVEKATGAYKSLKGTGTIDVTLTPAKTPNHAGQPHGDFKFTIA